MISAFNTKGPQSNGRLHIAVSIDYLSFMDLANINVPTLKKNLNDFGREIQQEMHLAYSNSVNIRFRDLFGREYDFYVGDSDLTVYTHRQTIGRWVLPDDIEERRDAFRQATKRAEAFSTGKKPCLECGEPGGTRLGLSCYYCDACYAALTEKRRRNCAWDVNCKQAYWGDCVCITYLICPEHGTQHIGSHD